MMMMTTYVVLFFVTQFKYNSVSMLSILRISHDIDLLFTFSFFM
jgi:hypothetical protein